MIKEKKHTFSLSDNGLSETTSSMEVFESWLFIRATVALLTVLCFPALIAMTCSESKWSWSSFGVSTRIKTKSNLESRALPILKRRERKKKQWLEWKQTENLAHHWLACLLLTFYVEFKKGFRLKEQAIAFGFNMPTNSRDNRPYALQYVHSFIPL